MPADANHPLGALAANVLVAAPNQSPELLLQPNAIGAPVAASPHLANPLLVQHRATVAFATQGCPSTFASLHQQRLPNLTATYPLQQQPAKSPPAAHRAPPVALRHFLQPQAQEGSLAARPPAHIARSAEAASSSAQLSHQSTPPPLSAVTANVSVPFVANSSSNAINHHPASLLPQFTHLLPRHHHSDIFDGNLQAVPYQRLAAAQEQLNFEDFQLAAPIASAPGNPTSAGQTHNLVPHYNPFTPYGTVPPAATAQLQPQAAHPSIPISAPAIINTNGAALPRVQHQATQEIAAPPSAEQLAAEEEKAALKAKERKEKARLNAEKRKLKREQQEKANRARAEKAAATRKRNRLRKEEEARQRVFRQQEEIAQEELAYRMQALARDSRENLVISMISVGDRVLCSPKGPNVTGDELAEIVLVRSDRKEVYVHFVDRDRRMDRWTPISEVRKVTLEDIKAHDAAQAGKLTRAKTRQLQERNPVSEKETGNEAVARAEREREERTKVKNIGKIVFGAYELESWYFSPFPAAPEGESLDRIFMCQFCLKYHHHASRYLKHQSKCAWVAPPGKRVYHDNSTQVSVFEIDGMVNMAYCQRLCLLGKLFLDHKTLFFDVAPFLFYVVTRNGEVAGFFSKEKPERRSEFNLACIMSLPHHQKKGIGRFMIEFSYELSKLEGKMGSPERPLSDLGQVSYRSFWMYEVLRYARAHKNEVGITVESVSEATRIRTHDIIEVLKSMHMLNIWKGESYIDCSAKVIESAAPRVREARLKLNSELLDYEARTANGLVISPPSASKSSPAMARTPVPSPKSADSLLGKRARSTKNRSKSRSTPDSKNAHTSRPSAASTPTPMRAHRMSTGPSQKHSYSGINSPSNRSPSASLLTPQANRSSRIMGAMSAFKDEEKFDECAALREAVRDFVVSNGIQKVIAPIDSKFGLSTTKYRAFGNHFGLSVDKTYQRAKSEAMDMMTSKHMSNVKLDEERDRKVARRMRSQPNESPSANGMTQSPRADSSVGRVAPVGSRSATPPVDDASKKAARGNGANGLHIKASPKAVATQATKSVRHPKPVIPGDVQQRESAPTGAEHGERKSEHGHLKRMRSAVPEEENEKLNNQEAKVQRVHRGESSTSPRKQPNRGSRLSQLSSSNGGRSGHGREAAARSGQNRSATRGGDIMEVIVISSDEE